MKKNFTTNWAAVSLLAVMLFVTNCKRTVPPTVAMVESSIAVSYDKACLVAEVVSDGGGTITEYGFCYGKLDETPDTLLCQGIESAFSVELSNLSPSTVYTCRAFARNERGRGYSDVYRFTTLNAIDTIPLVDTYTVKDITYCSAVPSGIVLSGGGQEVIERGICYGAEPVPTIEGMHVALGSGVGPFECQITDLLPETRYYICAYAICTRGIYYGDQLAFDTKPLPLEVQTGEVSDVTASRVRADGKVIRDGGYEVTECGFCWGTEHEPTIEGLHIKASVGLGKYSCYFSGLQQGQTHYVRAYAINEEGVAYGEEVEFVPDDPFLPWPNGTLPGLFSVSEDRKVRFSQGNLQYYPDDDLWRFAEDQWDFVGGTCFDDNLGEMNVGTVYADGAKCDNTKVFKYYPGWVDLFGWATSGWDNGNIYYKPYDFTGHISPIWYQSNDCAYYGPCGNFDLTGDYVQADWGVHNTINNGGSRQWRTPSADEFNYLLLERETPSGVRFAKAVVGGVRGMVVLPDDWNASNYPLNDVNMDCDYYENKITCGEWLDVLEPAGAVFLPAAGRRLQWMGETNITYSFKESMSSYIEGNYWTSSACDGIYYGVDHAKECWFSGTDGVTYFPYFDLPSYRCYGFSVRLVSDE
jgi:hypothetical protein